MPQQTLYTRVTPTRLFLVQNPASIYNDLPKSAEDLRRTLAKVSLRAWLPSLLCPPPTPEKDEVTATADRAREAKADHNKCRETVEAALVAQPHVEVKLSALEKVRDNAATSDDVITTIR